MLKQSCARRPAARAVALTLMLALLAAAFSPALWRVSADDAPTKLMVLENFDGRNTFTWDTTQRAPDASSFTDGVYSVTVRGNDTAGGVSFTVAFPSVTGVPVDLSVLAYDYIEFDIRSSHSNLVQWPSGTQTTQTLRLFAADSETAAGKQAYQVTDLNMRNAIGTLTPNEWKHVKIPLTQLAKRAADVPDHPARIAKLSSFKFTLQYSGTYNLQKDQSGNPIDPIVPVNVGLKNFKATSYATEIDAAVENVVRTIDAIGKVGPTSHAAIQAARNAYDGLAAEKQAAVANYNILLAAEAGYAPPPDPLRDHVVDAFDGGNQYLYEPTQGQISRKFENGYFEIQTQAKDTATGVDFVSSFPVVYDTTGYEYIEFDLWTNHPRLFAGANDTRIMLGANDFNTMTHQTNSTTMKALAAEVAADAEGNLATEEWIHFKIPLTALTRRTADFPTVAEEVGAYRLMIKYNGANNLGGSLESPVILRLRDLAFTSYLNTGDPVFEFKQDSVPTQVKDVDDFSDLSYFKFNQAYDYFLGDDYLEMRNNAAQHDGGFDFEMNLPGTLDLTGYQYLELDFWTNNERVASGTLDARMFFASTSVMDGVVSHQINAGNMRSFFGEPPANQWTHVRIPLSALIPSSSNTGKLEFDPATVYFIGFFFRYNAVYNLGATDDNPVVVRFKNLQATAYAEANPIFVKTNAAYTVTFQNPDGGTLGTQTVRHGSGANAPAKPVRAGYTFTGWDRDFSRVTSDLTVTAQYHSDDQATLKSEAEAAIAAIASSVTASNYAAQAELIAAARLAVNKLLAKFPSVSTGSIAGYAKYTTAQSQYAAVIAAQNPGGLNPAIDGAKDAIYTDDYKIPMNKYFTGIGKEQQPSQSRAGSIYYRSDDKYVYVYVECPSAAGRIEARLDADPSKNDKQFATYDPNQSDTIIRLNADNTFYTRSAKPNSGKATHVAYSDNGTTRALEFRWERKWGGASAADDRIGLSAYATLPGDNAYAVAPYYDWDDYAKLRFYYLMSMSEIKSTIVGLIDDIDYVTEENWSDQEDAITAARTMINNALASYDNFSIGQISNYDKLREAEYRYNFYFNGGTGEPPSMPELPEIDILVTTDAEFITIDNNTKVIIVEVEEPLTVQAFIDLLNYDQGVPKVINYKGQALKSTAYITENQRFVLTVGTTGQATYDILYLGPPVENDEDDVIGDETGGNGGDSGPDTGDNASAALLLTAALLAAAALTLPARRKRTSR